MVQPTSDQMKAALEQALRTSEMKYALAVNAAGINIWEYDIGEDALHLHSSSSRVYQASPEIKNYVRTVLESGCIRADSREDFLRIHERLKAGEKEVTADIWYQTTDFHDYWCEHVTYLTELDGSGVPVRAFGVGRDVTREKEAEKQYRREVAYREVMQTATMASMNLNLSRNTVLEYKSKYPEISENMAKAGSAQDYIESVIAQLKTEEMQKNCRSVFGVKQLLSAFSVGRSSVSMELVRTIGDRDYWTEVNAYMMKNPENDDVVAFMYSTDSTNEKVMSGVMASVVRTDYEYLVVVDGLRDSAARYSENNTGYPYAETSNNFEEQTRGYISRYIVGDDVEQVLGQFTLKNILAHLDSQGCFSMYYSMRTPEGRLQRKQLRFSYIYPKHKIFLMARTDITAVYEEKEKQNEALAAALKLAEQASATKSEFLSRMSHEIRTPMNAIMGMAEIAASNVTDSAFVVDCIRKSQEAARYLLSLINDILDMSRIESGKITLAHQTFSTKELFDAVNTMMEGQAALQKVTYIFERDSSVAEAFIGDETRIKQIVINLINNAIKFTQPGGMVKLSVRQPVTGDGRATLQCVVSDTGIGISSDFLPLLFDTFTQEKDGTTEKFSGSGLGLPIARNLARLMGGDITAESRLREGSSFTASMELDLARAREPEPGSPGMDEAEDFDFSGRQILLCEDHPLNTMVAKRLLENKGFTVLHAENGRQGVELFEKSDPDAVSAILMDIRMPVMDGLEAARAIRALDRPDAAAVPIIAMTANAYEDDHEKSRLAGMNMHLSKPIEPQKLYEAIRRCLDRRDERP